MVDITFTVVCDRKNEKNIFDWYVFWHICNQKKFFSSINHDFQVCTIFVDQVYHFIINETLSKFQKLKVIQNIVYNC